MRAAVTGVRYAGRRQQANEQVANTILKLTVNKPAADIAFRTAPFVQFRIDNGVLYVCGSVTGPAENTVAAQTTRRGGYTLYLKDEHADEVLAVLEPTSDNSFYTLVPAHGEWFRAERRQGVPPRHVPWLRVWRPEEPFEKIEMVFDANLFTSYMRDARRLVESVSNNVGRPSVNLLRARELLAAFDLEAKQNGWVKTDTRPVADAINLLEEYLSNITQKKRITKIDSNKVRASVRFAEHSDNETVQSALGALLVVVELEKSVTDSGRT